MNIVDTRFWKRFRKNKILFPMYKKYVGKYITNLFLNVKDRRREVQTFGIETIQEVDEILAKHGATFFLGNGSLLGIARDGMLIQWDYDIDYGIFIDESFSWLDLEKLLTEIGFKKYKEFYFEGKLLTEQTYIRNNIHIDFFRHFHNDDETLFYSYYTTDGQDYVSNNEQSVRTFNTVKVTGAKIINVGENQFHVPKEYEEYLSGLYTPSWRIPNPNWVAGSGPACHILEDKRGFCKVYDS